jgi:hypothetical protein
LKKHVAALDVGAHLRAACLGTKRRERRHGQFVFTANVDSEQKCNVLGHESVKVHPGFSAAHGFEKLPPLRTIGLMRTFVPTAVLCAAFVSSSLVADFNYSNFASLRGLQLNGDCAPNGDLLALTPDAVGQAGSAFCIAKQKLSEGFDTTFVVNIDGKGGKFGFGDGMAFVIQSFGSNYLGSGGGGLGYEGAVTGLAVEIDTWPSDQDEIAVHATQALLRSASCMLSAEDGTELASVDGLTIKDANDHTIRVNYVPGTLSVYLDDSRDPLLTLKIDLASYECLGSQLLDSTGHAWIGFTAGTGGATERNGVKSWSFSNDGNAGCATVEGDIASVDCLETNGNAGPCPSGGLRLTQALEGQAGSAWVTQKQHLSCGFDTEFSFQMSGGGDGMAFVIQNAGLDALGGGGSGMGYGSNGPDGIPSSLAVEIDTFSFSGEIPADHLSVQTNGIDFNNSEDSYSLGSVVPGVELDDGAVHTLRVLYADHFLWLFLDGASSPITTAFVDLENINGNSILDPEGNAWIGFTAGTGLANQTHDVVLWSFTSTPTSVADLNGDCAVDGADLGQLLGAWGHTSGPEDLNGDSLVDGGDLGMLLGAWGS